MNNVAAPVDAGDLSIVIPFREDAPERRENLVAVLERLGRDLVGAEIIVIEHASAPSAAGLPALPGLRHVPMAHGGAFHRTRMLNDGIETLASRPFAASWDTDVLAHPAALASALDLLRDGAGLVYPFDGRFIDVRGTARRRVLDGAALSTLPWPDRRLRWWQRRGDVVCENEASVGGAVLFDRAAFTRTGGYHEGFVAWGFEDAEIRDRMEKLGVEIARVPGYPLFHLAHPRGRARGGWYRSVRANRALYREWAALDADELAARVADGALRA
ncbi:MAG: galactosyltransferase-related protein [Pseudomonadota bacterium]